MSKSGTDWQSSSRILAGCWISFCLSVGACSSSNQGFTYSEEPLKTAAIEPARVLVESVGINNWLGANYTKMVPRQTQGAREHLHALIDSRIKELYSTNKTLMPRKPDAILAMLYSWAGRLGVYGADQVYAVVRGNYAVEPPPGPRPPEGLSLDLQGESLLISSKSGGWQASVPYYFFIFVLDYVEPSNSSAASSERSEAAVISTGSAPVVMPPGYSQATIAMYFTAGAALSEFEPEWCARLQIACATEQNVVAGTTYRSRVEYDERTRLHKEVVFAQSDRGAFAILYAGLDGTYQPNRPHFIDFLRNLKTAEVNG